MEAKFKNSLAPHPGFEPRPSAQQAVVQPDHSSLFINHSKLSLATQEQLASQTFICHPLKADNFLHSFDWLYTGQTYLRNPVRKLQNFWGKYLFSESCKISNPFQKSLSKWSIHWSIVKGNFWLFQNVCSYFSSDMSSKLILIYIMYFMQSHSIFSHL